MIIPGFKGLDKDNCVLNEHCIDLWQFSLAEELANANELLNAEEQARAARFYFQRHQRRFATGRATLRMILARYLNTPPECLQFSYNAHGKPTVMNAASLEFNLSHTEDLALLAIGKKHPLGVDIEKYTARPYEGIAKSLFSDQEFKAFIKTPHVLKPAVFFHVWSQKEAFIKACGLGQLVLNSTFFILVLLVKMGFLTPFCIILFQSGLIVLVYYLIEKIFPMFYSMITH